MLRGVNVEIRENYTNSNCVHLSAEVGPTSTWRTCGRRNERKKKRSAFKKYIQSVFLDLTALHRMRNGLGRVH